MKVIENTNLLCTEKFPAFRRTAIKPFVFVHAGHQRVVPVWLELFQVRPKLIHLINRAVTVLPIPPRDQTLESFLSLPVKGTESLVTNQAVMWSAHQWRTELNGLALMRATEEFTFFRFETAIGWLCGTFGGSVQAVDEFLAEYASATV